MSSKRLYIFTGKGGVGKTTLSHAFVRSLNQQNLEAVYLTFRSQALGENSVGTTEMNKEGVKEISLDLEECARGYIEKNLKSGLIASWVVKSPFFRALVNMVPGFSYVIFMGRVLQMQKENPRLIVVLDAPASGHALTMVESTTNFKNIFQSGVIFEDTGKMLALLNDPEYTKIFVVSLPSLMSWQEAKELEQGLKERTPAAVEIVVNNCLYPLLEGRFDELPQGLKDKALNEKLLVDEHRQEAQCILTHSLSLDTLAIERDLVGSLSNLI